MLATNLDEWIVVTYILSVKKDKRIITNGFFQFTKIIIEEVVKIAFPS